MSVRTAHMKKIFTGLEIQLFGTPQLVLNGQVLEDLPRKNRALLFYRPTQGGQPSREKLLTFFWPDHERSTAQPILRTMIHDLRKQLAESIQVDDQNMT